MEDYRGFDMFEVMVLIARRKRDLAILFLCSMLLAYAGIYLFVEDQYEASSTIVSVEDQNSGMLSSVLKSFDALPMKLGSSGGKAELDKFNTIVFSRTTLEDLLAHFNLYAIYGYDSSLVIDRERAVKKLKKNIVALETNESAYQVVCTARDPKLAADMANYLVEVLNRRVVSLRVSKSQDNRLFLEKRVREVKNELRSSEDSMRVFQERSGMLEITSQMKEMLSVYANLEAELISKQVQLSILENIYEKGSPQVESASMEMREYRKKLTQMRGGRERGSIVLGLDSLPKNSIEYLRHFRNIEINNAVLKFIVPMYEQSKFDEKKDYPVIQVIDTAIPPGKRSFPPRTLLSLAISSFVLLSVVGYWFVSEKIRQSTNPRLTYLRDELFVRRKKG
jgi:tyrosine-protein kinase Etk/Wzc